MEPDSAGQRPRSRPRWLAEGVLILVSVALGFGAAQFGEYRNDQALGRRMLVSLGTELRQNLVALKPMVPLHRKWTEALHGADLSNASQSALDVWFATRPELPPGANSSFPFLRRSAWDAAVAGGALRLIDYEVTATLSEIYRVQEIVNDNVNRLANGALSSAATYDPASRGPSTRLLWLTLADIASAEELLLELYEKHLPAIQRAAGAPLSQ